MSYTRERYVLGASSTEEKNDRHRSIPTNCSLMRALVLFIRDGRMPSPWQLYERQQQKQQRGSATTGLKTNNIHRVLTPRVGQRKPASGRGSDARGRLNGSDGRRRTRPGSGRNGSRNKSGRRRNTGTRRKTIRYGNETCACACRSS